VLLGDQRELRPCCLQRVPTKEDEDNVVGGWYETMRLHASAISASGRGRKLANIVSNLHLKGMNLNNFAYLLTERTETYFISKKKN
jgi:hypothetical protein